MAEQNFIVPLDDDDQKKPLDPEAPSTKKFTQNYQHSSPPVKESMGLRKTLWSTVIVFGIAGSWVVTTQVSKMIVSRTNAVLFLSWFSTNFNLLCWVFWIGQFFINSREKKGLHAPLLSEESSIDELHNSGESEKENQSHTRSHDLGMKESLFAELQNQDVPQTPLSVLVRALLFYALWVCANYCYSKALEFTDATTVTSVFASTPILVFLLSLLMLSENFTIFKLASVGAAVAGILLLFGQDLFFSKKHNEEWIGITLTLGASVFAAHYKVLIKKIFGDSNLATISLLLTYIGCYNLVLSLGGWLLFWAVGYEEIDFSKIQFPLLTAIGLVALLFNFLINFGISYSSPLFIAIGTVLGIPLNAVIDHFVRHTHFGMVKAAGCCLIMVAFLLISIQPSALLPFLSTKKTTKLQSNSINE